MSVQFPKPGPPLGRPDEQTRPAPADRSDGTGTPFEEPADVTSAAPEAGQAAAEQAAAEQAAAEQAAAEQAAAEQAAAEVSAEQGALEVDESSEVDAFAHDIEDQSATGDPEEHAPAATEHTGNHAVDRVLESLDTLAEKPVDEHVAVFEQAHEQLRGALDGPRLPRP